MGEDHTKDRDWLDAVPKRLLAALGSVLVVFGSATGTAAVTMIRDRWDAIERAANDPWKAQVALMEQRLSRTEMTVQQHEGLISALDMRQQLSEVQGDIKAINAKLNLMNERMRKVE